MALPRNDNDDARFLELLNRWLRGDFTRADERALRALVEADAFRREAWEGLQALPEADHEARLRALRRRFQPVAETPALRATVNRRRAFSVAAAILVLIVGAVWLLRLPRPDQAAERASTAQQTEAAPADTAVETPVPESTSPAADAGYAAAEPAAPRTRGGVPVRPSAPRSDDRPQPATARDDAAAGAASTMAAAPPTAVTSDSQDAEESADRVVEQAKESMAQPDEPAAKRAGAPKKSAALPPPAPYVGPAPELGWPGLARALAAQARLNREARNNNVSGAVRLRFELDGDGRPRDFTVLRSLPYGLDAEAIRLVSSFRWPAGTVGPVEVEVPFVR